MLKTLAIAVVLSFAAASAQASLITNAFAGNSLSTGAISGNAHVIAVELPRTSK